MNKERAGRKVGKEKAHGDDRTIGGESPIVVVGIGASEGSRESVQKLFAGMPLGHGVAFVLVQHTQPGRENAAVKILGNRTEMSVVEATDGMPVLADRIHVMPPEKFLSISEGKLTLQAPVVCDGLRMPIDHFLCSLAVAQRRRACGVLLSGTGSDGILGLSEIKAAMGRTIIEDPGGAGSHDPHQNTPEAGVANLAIGAAAMAEAIIVFADEVGREIGSDSLASPELDAGLRTILDIIRARAGHDFRCYKPSTMVRRIRRRMTLAKVPTFTGYARFLGENPDEAILLQKDLLIGVTEFFRQPQAWEVLGEKVIAGLVEKAPEGAEIRAWVPGCSTGKEAYSLAIMLAERIEASGKKVGFQIFATDSEPAALAAARGGSYAEEEIGESISAERLGRFFERKSGLYQVIKGIRERIVFAPQNLTTDPPFSRLDLVSCRNLLIYLDPQVQQKIIALFHFALREGGFLFLGTAETIGDREDLFEPVSKKWRIYRRIGVGHPVGVEIPVRPAGEAQPSRLKLSGVTAPSRVSLASAAQQILLDRFAPACVMIDRKLQVLYVHGPVEEYLTFPAGELTTRVVDMAREGLRARLRGAIGKCLEANRPVSVTARVLRGGKSVPVRAQVSPLKYPQEIDGLLLISFEDYLTPAGGSRRPAAGKDDLLQLQDELKVTREELQSTIEQLEGSNDQLKASNEEVTAANEELQSANEELETSKEELQSLNEELNTINARLEEKVDELETVNNDVVNLLSSTNIATVFLDKELKVKRYTPASTRLFSLIPTDAGRPVEDILCRFDDDTLLADSTRVLADLTPLSKEVQADDGRWYIRRITPYRTQDDRIEGVVITFVDVCDLKQVEEALRQAHERAEWLARFPEENPNPVFRVAQDGTVLYINPAAARLTGWQRRVGQPLPDALRPLLDRAVTSGQFMEADVELGGTSYAIAVIPIPAERYVNIYGRDITERKRAEDALRKRTAELAASEQRFRLVLQNAPVVVANLDRDLRYTWAFNLMGGFTPEDVLGEEVGLSADPETRQRIFKSLEEVLTSGASAHWEMAARTKTGVLHFESHAEPLRSADGEITGVSLVSIDISERKRAEEALELRTAELQELTATLEARVKERTAELARLNETLKAEMEERLRLVTAIEQTEEGIVIIDTSGRIDYANPAFERTSGRGAHELPGKSYFDLLSEEGGDGRLRKKVEAAVERAGSWDGRLTRKSEGGQVRELDVTVSPIRGRTGAITNYLAVERDMTMESRLQQHLRQLQKVEALGTLAGGIAHDFNNLLNPIFINTELALLDAPPDDPTRQYLQTVLQAAERGKELVKQIITFSRQKEKERKPLKAEPLVKEALKFLRSSLPRTIEIREDIQKGTAPSWPTPPRSTRS